MASLAVANPAPPALAFGSAGFADRLRYFPSSPSLIQPFNQYFLPAGLPARRAPSRRLRPDQWTSMCRPIPEPDAIDEAPADLINHLEGARPAGVQERRPATAPCLAARFRRWRIELAAAARSARGERAQVEVVRFRAAA
jgi:hypothetical protein